MAAEVERLHTDARAFAETAVNASPRSDRATSERAITAAERLTAASRAVVDRARRSHPQEPTPGRTQRG
ncbi:hypothetical protein OG863_40580 [Streptomyces decoyicus]|uniref:Uncharacterized protein n=1 Tax=Streptomyces decoyicus TaxID=249567 RepID=A0ABZ1FT98_9ACTN|nr:hypothetical protein [Streptomyces decoyicus]WSB73726.1 hypothetical protein OG863_40580 [Streptomyces decoyicus]